MFTDNLDDMVFILVKYILKNLITSKQWQEMQTLGRMSSNTPNAIDKLDKLSENQQGKNSNE